MTILITALLLIVALVLWGLYRLIKNPNVE